MKGATSYRMSAKKEFFPAALISQKSFMLLVERSFVRNVFLRNFEATRPTKFKKEPTKPAAVMTR